ncbi:MAG TPA: dual specificity protein phosphatase [Dehalococcoidia bacterium]|nr:dual specificity protein phosphatase [Dehalococcoidia bacterium]
MLRQLWERLRPPRLLVWITPELALGPAPSKHQIRLLARAGVNSVLDVRSEASDDESHLAGLGLRFLRLPIDDFRAPSREQLSEATEWTLAELAAGRKVYVHCRSGIGRSPCVACAILMAMGYPLPDAYTTVRRERPWATLSDTQQAALADFETRLRERAATIAQD